MLSRVVFSQPPIIVLPPDDPPAASTPVELIQAATADPFSAGTYIDLWGAVWQLGGVYAVHANFNANWLTQNAGTVGFEKGWNHYRNWINGIADPCNYRVWYGTESDFKGYSSWWTQERRLTCSAFPP